MLADRQGAYRPSADISNVLSNFQEVVSDAMYDFAFTYKATEDKTYTGKVDYLAEWKGSEAGIGEYSIGSAETPWPVHEESAGSAITKLLVALLVALLTFAIFFLIMKVLIPFIKSKAFAHKYYKKYQIETLMQLFDEPSTQIGTLGKRFESIEAAMNPNSPKIVTDKRGFALYFSRSIIPYVRGKEQSEWLQHFPYLKHLGLYAYRREVLQEVTQLPQSPLEIAESLEQLRWLENGYRIRVGLTDVETVGIDTPEDLQRAEEFLASRK